MYRNLKSNGIKTVIFELHTYIPYSFGKERNYKENIWFYMLFRIWENLILKTCVHLLTRSRIHTDFNFFLFIVLFFLLIIMTTIIF